MFIGFYSFFKPSHLFHKMEENRANDLNADFTPEAEANLDRMNKLKNMDYDNKNNEFINRVVQKSVPSKN